VSSSVLRRLAPALLLALGALASGCQQSTLPIYSNVVRGSYGLTLVGDLLFITSADNNELRVLDTSVTPREFVRAPNPLEPLSIAVVARPVGVVREYWFDPDGEEMAGRYVYAYSSAVPEISVVGAERAQLTEVLRLKTEGPVSALSAHAPDPVRGETESVLYYATAGRSATGSEGQLWRVRLGAPDAPNPRRELLQTYPGEFIAALAAMPDPGRVIVATRAERGRQGRTFLLDTDRGSYMLPQQFPAPVRLLQISPRVPGSDLGAGRYVWGVLDEEACGADIGCQGILATDVNTGQIAQDVTGAPMVPISLGRALPISLNFTRSALINGVGENGASGLVDLLGMGTSSNGEIFFFDAAARRHFDTLPTINPAVASTTLYKPDGTTVGHDATRTGPLGMVLQNGAAKDEILSVIREGIIIGQYNLRTTAAMEADRQTFPTGPSTASAIVPGDRVVLTSGNPGCNAELTVASVAPASVTTTTPAPAGCMGNADYSIRAGPGTDQPYTVSGSVSGFMGRVRPGQSFTYQGYYFFHPNGFTPGSPQLSFTMGAEDPQVGRDWRYAVVTTSGFLRLSFTLDTLSFPGYYLPGAVVHLPGKPVAFAAYPSANGVIEFNPPLIIPNIPNGAQNIVSYP
jgi:hypothetical protein